MLSLQNNIYLHRKKNNMILQELIILLNKYNNNNNINNIRDISEGLNKIMKSLQNIRNNLADAYHKSLISDDEDINCDIDINDIMILKKEITVLKGEIEKLPLSNTNEVPSDNIEISLSNRPKITVYRFKDSDCPICHCSMNNTSIVYKFIENNEIKNKLIPVYRCPKCNKIFSSNINENIQKSEENNLNIKEDFYFEYNKLDYFSVIVLSTIRACSYRNHNISDVNVQVPIILEDGTISNTKLAASYCKTCNRYIILKDDFKKIKDIIACEVIDETVPTSLSSNDDIEIAQKQSLLYKRGYNVKSKDNISQEQRQAILALAIDNRIMTKHSIMDHLTTLIDRGSKIEKWYQATQKWKIDRQFVSGYNQDTYSQVCTNRVTLKYQEKNKNANNTKE